MPQFKPPGSSPCPLPAISLPISVFFPVFGVRAVDNLLAVALAIAFYTGEVLLVPFKSQLSFSLLIIVGLFLGLGYTIPPLKFSYRGLGEIVVSITHSIYVILCGFVFQGGMWDDPRPWVMSVPMFFSIFAAVTLAGVPDRQADEGVRKKTVAVIFGPRRALMTAIFCVGIAYLSAFLCWYYGVMAIAMGFFTLLVLPHGVILIHYLAQLLGNWKYERKINREMGLSLGYIIWFGLLPLFSLWR